MMMVTGNNYKYNNIEGSTVVENDWIIQHYDGSLSYAYPFLSARFESKEETST